MKSTKVLRFLSRPFHTAAQKHFNKSDTRRHYLLKYGTLAGFVAIPTVSYFSLDDRKKREIRLTIGGVERFVRSTKIGIEICIDYWWTLRSLDETDANYAGTIQCVHKRCADRILEGCLKNGGLYIKLGQGLVNLDHLLPKEYIQSLKVLQDKCLQRKKNEVRQLFEEDFGTSHQKIFASFDETPIAAASLAQVFKAKMQNGTDVAVKVQYIDLRDRFHGDVNTVDFLLKLVARIFPKYDFQWILEEVKGPLELELDFTSEGHNAEKCGEDLAQLGYIHVPKVYWELTTKRILTTEFIEGIKISESEELEKNGLSLVDIDTKLFSVFAEQIFHTGFIHADPHPGNILVRKRRDDTAELVLLDHGLYGTLPDDNRISLSNLWRAVVMNNHSDMKKYSRELGITDQYRLFCIALTQRYVPLEDSNQRDIIKQVFGMQILPFRSALKDMSKDERIKLENEVVKIHDELLDVFKKLPGKLILICRNLNAVRAIAKTHGNPVDRHKVMAHCATHRLFSQSVDRSVCGIVKNSYYRLVFEFKLWCDSVRQLILRLYLQWFWKSITNNVDQAHC